MGLKILTVDDSAFMRNIVKNALTGTSVGEISEAGSADEAVAKFKEKQPDLTFMDIVMPGKTGLDALKEIRAINPNAKVVMCTSVGQEKIVEEAVNAGAYDFITKPFKPEEIKNVVAKISGEAGGQTAAPTQPAPSPAPIQPVPQQNNAQPPAQPAPSPAPAQPAPQPDPNTQPPAQPAPNPAPVQPAPQPDPNAGQPPQ